MTELLSGVDAPSDAELISAVRGGDVAAYGELFSRHVEAARRLGRQLVRGTDVDDLVSDAFAKTLQVLQNGGGPDVAFRAYLLTSVRRLHVDRIRASKRVQPSDDMTEFDDGIPFQDTAVASFENGAAAKAFASLPERWQLVLWHLEVEGQKPADIAPLLGMSPNSVSALAYRAREGLRQAFLTMHLADSATEQCRWTNEHLGAFVRSGLSKRDTTKVQSHLDECRRCTAMYLELNEVNSNLAGIIAPLLLGAAAAGYVSSAGAGATGLAAVFGRIRDALTGNTGGGSGAATTTSTGGVASGGAASGGAAAATGAAGAAGAAASGAAVAAGSAATLGGILTVGGAIAAGVAVVTTAAFVVGGSGDKETVTGADRPAVVQTPTGAAAPSEFDTSGTDPEASEDPSAAPSDEAAVDYVVPNPGTASVDPAATTDTPPSSSPQDVAPPPAPAPADPAPGAPAPNDPAPNEPPADEPGPAPAEPTSEPTTEPTAEPTAEPTSEPSTDPTTKPTALPTALPTSAPTTVAPPPPVNTLPSDPVTSTPPSEPTPPVRATNTQVNGENVSITFDADEVPDEISLVLASDPEGIEFRSSDICSVDDPTHATCVPTTARAASVFARAVPFVADEGTQFTLDVPLRVPANQQDGTEMTISYAVNGSSTYTPVTVDPIELRITDVKLGGVGHQVQPDSAGTYRVTPTVTGLPPGSEDPSGPFTFDLTGAATFVGLPAECTASDDATSVTCPEVDRGAIEFDLAADPSEHDTEVTLSVSPLDGFVDGDLENNRRTFALAARSYNASIASAESDILWDETDGHQGTVTLAGVSGLPHVSIHLDGAATLDSDALISATECEILPGSKTLVCEPPPDEPLRLVVAAEDEAVATPVSLSLAVPDGYVDPVASDNAVTWTLQPRQADPTPEDPAVFTLVSATAQSAFEMPTSWRGNEQHLFLLNAKAANVPDSAGAIEFSFSDRDNHFLWADQCGFIGREKTLTCSTSGAEDFNLTALVSLPPGKDGWGDLVAEAGADPVSAPITAR